MDKDGVVRSGVLGEIKEIREKRSNGTIRIQQDFEDVPSMAEQHTAYLSDINYLMEKYKPDELAQYLAARNQYRMEIVGHDFSQEPNLQQAMNTVYDSKQEFEALPDEIKNQFKSHVEFLKFVDNPLNREKLVKLGLIKPPDEPKPDTAIPLQPITPIIPDASKA